MFYSCTGFQAEVGIPGWIQVISFQHKKVPSIEVKKSIAYGVGVL